MATYSIKDIEIMSGIKAHTIRMWERRFGLVIPKRTDTNIRYYTDEDLRNILNISILNQNGLKISKIAQLNKDELREEVEKLLYNSDQYAHVVDAMLFSMIEINEKAFNNSFTDALQDYGLEKLIEDIVYPFLERIGILWQTRSIRPAQEHFITNLLRQKIIATIEKDASYNKNEKHKIIFFLPEGEIHEIGLLFYSYIARIKGIEVIYLGSSIPLQDLKEVQKVTNANAFFSAHLNAIEKEKLEEMFLNLRESFPDDIVFYVTGLQIKDHNPSLPHNFFVVPSASVFKEFLEELD